MRRLVAARHVTLPVAVDAVTEHAGVVASAVRVEKTIDAHSARFVTERTPFGTLGIVRARELTTPGQRITGAVRGAFRRMIAARAFLVPVRARNFVGLAPQAQLVAAIRDTRRAVAALRSVVRGAARLARSRGGAPGGARGRQVQRLVSAGRPQQGDHERGKEQGDRERASHAPATLTPLSFRVGSW